MGRGKMRVEAFLLRDLSHGLEHTELHGRRTVLEEPGRLGQGLGRLLLAEAWMTFARRSRSDSSGDAWTVQS